MSGKVNLYAPFAGVKDGLTLLTLLSDKKKLKEVLATVKILDERIIEINQAIEVYGKASKMDSLLRDAAQKDVDAQYELDEAKKAAEHIYRDTKSWADDLLARLKTREEVVAENEKILAAGRERLTSDTKTFDTRSAERESSISEREAKTVRLNEEAAVVKARLDTALENMKADVAAV